MTTTLTKYTDAFASVPVATYQPLIVRWYSALSLSILQQTLAQRGVAMVPQKKLWLLGEKTPTAFRFQWRNPVDPASLLDAPLPLHHAVEVKDRVQQAKLVKGNAPMGKVHSVTNQLRGLVPRRLLAPRLKPQDLKSLQDRVQDALKAFVADGRFRSQIIWGKDLPLFTPLGMEEALSPIGIAHLYRQLYFDVDAGVGPIEQVFSIAPNEEVEIIQESTRRTVMETIEETGLESTLENETSSKNLDEISDQVSSMIKTDMSVAISGQVGGTVGVYTVGASASASADVAAERSGESVRKSTRELNRKSAERIQKSYKLTVRNLSDVTERSEVRRLIKNLNAQPVNYALRRVMRKVRVKVQDLGPRLVWQLYVSKPGEGLAQSTFVYLREAQPVAVPDLPPGSPPRPESSVTTGSETTDIFVWTNPADNNDYYVFDIRVAAALDWDARTLTVDSISDANPGGKDAYAPGLGSLFVKNPDGVPADGSTVFRLGVAPGTAETVTVQYTLYNDPSAARLAAWQAQVDALRATMTAQELQDQFDRDKKTLTARSRVQPRPAADLRKEERYEIMNRMVSHLFASDAAALTPLEIEYFHRFFDESAIFYYAHPSWWKPRYATGAGGLGRESYQITDDSEPAPLGKSLGWIVQLDGDRRRSEFLNSPWVRVCVPIRPGLEREAIAWLARHLEGEAGYETGAGTPVGDLLSDIETQRRLEKAAETGPDYVTLDGQVAPTNTDDAAAYPVISEFEITLPTEGFAYDEVVIQD